MTDSVAIVSIALSGAVAVAIPFVNDRVVRRRHMSEMEQTRLDGVYALLDDTFDRMSKALADLQVFDAACNRHELRSRWCAFTITSDQIVRDQACLVMRLGPNDPVTRAHAEAAGGFQHARATLHEWSLQLTALHGSSPAPIPPRAHDLLEAAALSMRSFTDAVAAWPDGTGPAHARGDTGI